jgi:phosphatidylethanolamine-binding protein (PEBP) family uncharacterized protein
MDDPDAPNGTWIQLTYWILFNIASNINNTTLNENGTIGTTGLNS